MKDMGTTEGILLALAAAGAIAATGGAAAPAVGGGSAAAGGAAAGGAAAGGAAAGGAAAGGAAAGGAASIPALTLAGTSAAAPALSLGGGAGATGLSVASAAAPTATGLFGTGLSTSSALGAAGLLGSAWASMEQGKVAADQANLLAEQERENAKAEMLGAHSRIKAVLSLNNADAGARGLDSSSGSQQVLAERNAEEFIGDKGAIDRNSRLRQGLFKSGASAARRQAKIRAGSSIFAAGSSLYDTRY